MSIRLQGSRSTTPLAKGKVHRIILLKLLFLALVFISIIGILKSPNLRLILSSSDSSQHEEATFSAPSIEKEVVKEAIVTSALSNDTITANKESEKTTHAVNDGSSVLNQHPMNTMQAPNNATSRVETLALLYPPGLIGGYRNQVMRFTAFVRHAIQEQIPQMLLPSIYFSTTYEKDTAERIFYPIRMKDVFDVEYWNEYASHNELPSLVESIGDDSDCWSSTSNTNSGDDIAQEDPKEIFASTIQQYSKALDPASPTDQTPPMVLDLAKGAEFLTPLRNLSLAITSGQAIMKRPRKVGVIPLDLKCQHPKTYGGGKGGAGVLWNDFLYKISKEVNSTVIHSVSQALRPAKQWQDVAHQCIHQGSNQQFTNAEKLPYFALHTRVELEMMRHLCGQYMEMNLSKSLVLCFFSVILALCVCVQDCGANEIIRYAYLNICF